MLLWCGRTMLLVTDAASIVPYFKLFFPLTPPTLNRNMDHFLNFPQGVNMAHVSKLIAAANLREKVICSSRFLLIMFLLIIFLFETAMTWRRRSKGLKRFHIIRNTCNRFHTDGTFYRKDERGLQRYGGI